MPVRKSKKKKKAMVPLINKLITANEGKETEVELEFDNLKLNGEIKLILSPVEKKR